MDQRWRFYWRSPSAEDPPGFGALHIWRHNAIDRKTEVVQPFVVKTLAEGESLGKPCIDFGKDGLGQGEDFQQDLMDFLWSLGIRPSGYALERDAQDRHLNDMRVLVGAFLKVELK